MMDWLFVSQAQRRLLPGGRFRGPTPWVVAIMTFVMLIVTAAALALANAAGAASEGSEGRYVAQLTAGSGDRGAAFDLIRQSEGVSSVQVVREGEMRRTLSRWLGAAASSADLPVPTLVHFDLDPSGNVRALQQRLETVAPGAVVSAHEAELRPLLQTMRALQWLALSLVALMLLATLATVVLAARAALDTNRPTIDVMHGIGATDVQVTQLFQRRIALDSAAGGTAGALCAFTTLALLAAGSAALSGQLGGLPPLHFSDLLLLACLPLILVVVATWVARTAVLRALRRAP